MTADNSVNGTTSIAALNSPFIKALVLQIRGQDSYGFYRNWSDELILKAFVVPKKKKREIPIDGEVDAATQARILVFFRAIAARIEQETNLISQVVVNINHEGFGWALVFSGRLLLTVKTLRDAHRFGFESLEKLAEEGEAFVQKGLDLVNRFPEVGKL
ncbi:NifX-associated nitrogen fixation protein [Nostoc sp. FACHB-152]|uniref:NifX-associated nitrogen fixation protein n=1 Tax=unclassified Nostoc TaxID=2593658 RepID=UPI001688E820|nr:MULTISPECIES: NifX-associated nitrogen fixation protein [unclassified Nostoc]MBD2446012.1 NifX-associated nitrogen fixation protein [Nostoc sp. FACHB-152]MBD2467244.1 NifX-associated nitrogen fixation protein [Nostoc sp. FACHB-145]